jgi:hypothetical protein
VVIALLAILLAAGVVLVQTPTAEAKKKAALKCPASSRAFKPAKARTPVLGAGKHRVVRVRRTADGAIGTPPVTTAGKSMVGWDHAVRPGSRKGTVILDAHTWPDGSALGNAMLRRLRKGDVIKLSSHGHAVCYRITSRKQYPRNRVPVRKIFRTGGAPRVAIFVCSGKRLGPGDWLKRTVWIGKVVHGRLR